jgi:predicted permease
LSDFWIPLGLYPRAVPLLAREGKPEGLRGMGWLLLDARLKPGVSREQAQAAVVAVAKRLDQAYPRRNPRNIRLVPGGSFPGGLGDVRLLLGVLMSVVGLVLLVACANVANLLLARSAARQKELGIRVAIGASRARPIRQLLVESVSLSLAGGVGGVGLTFAATALLGRLESSFPIPISLDLHLDWRVLLFTGALSLITGLLFGLAPALRSTQPELTSLLKVETSGFGAWRRFGLKNGLVVAQVALSLVLLVGAGLFLRSLQSASSIPLGMKTDMVLMMGFDPRATGLSSERSTIFFRELRERVLAQPNVEAASIIDFVPLSLHAHTAGVSRPGHDEVVPADTYGASAQYFRTMGIEILRGRDFDESTVSAANPGGRPPMVINEVVAAKLFGSEDPIGRTVNWETSPHEVIAVVRMTKSRSSSDLNPPQVYVWLDREYDQLWGFFGLVLVVKTHGAPQNSITPIEQQIRQLEPAMAIYNIQTMQTYLNKAMLVPRVCASLFGIFGLTGLILAAVGLYGVMSYSVRRRTKEIGIRMAIGAKPGDVLRLIGRQGFALVSTGVALGWLLSLGASRVVTRFLYGVSARDIATFLMVPAVLIVVALVAVWIPARRAASLEALESIRYE